MRTVSLGTACKILGETPATISGWRNRIGGQLAELGGRGEARFELRDIALFALIAELRASNRRLKECTASALMFQADLDDVFLERVPAETTIWIVEALWPSGRTKCLSGRGTTGLGQAVGQEIAAGASAFHVVDLSQLCRRVQHAWLAAEGTAFAAMAAQERAKGRTYTLEAEMVVPQDAGEIHTFPGVEVGKTACSGIKTP